MSAGVRRRASGSQTSSASAAAAAPLDLAEHLGHHGRDVDAARPGVAVLDVRLPDGDGVSVCRELRQTLPDLACLMLTSYGDDEALFESVMAGAAGYVLKEVRGGELLNAIRIVAAGGSLLDPAATTRLFTRLRTQTETVDPLRELSEQERKVLDLIGHGLTNRQIGAELFLSPATARTHVSHAMVKLGARDRAQLVVIAYQTGLISPQQ